MSRWLRTAILSDGEVGMDNVNSILFGTQEPTGDEQLDVEVHIHE